MTIKQKTDKPFPEVVFSTGDATHAQRVRRLAREGVLRRIYSGIFTSNLESPLESIVLRNWAEIVSNLLPGGVVSFRSAAAGKPENGWLYVTRGKTPRTIELPGLTIRVIPGTGAFQGAGASDTPYKGVFFSSEPRWLLENMATGRGVASRVLPQEAVEAHLEKILLIRGEYKLNALRDNCRGLAAALGMPKEFSRLDKIIGALLGTHEQRQLRSHQAIARAAGRPYDPSRLELFEALFSHLKANVMPEVPDRAPTGQALENFAFCEAYFSNFIEGTTFLVSEAEQIVFEGKVIPNRTEDSHDVLGTFQAASQAPWRNTPARSEDEFLVWLKSVNALVMKSRLDKRPGEWKDKPNQAGTTLFVDPTLVPGTLREGFARIVALEHPLARALMTMFVVSEVHPFSDGNGRTARLAMNAELTAGGLSRIIVPTVSREDYMLPLKTLSLQKDPVAYLRAMSRIQQWTAAFDYSVPRHVLTEALKACNAFEEDLRNFKLIFPEAGASS
jgi:hypothetical protein